MGIVEEFFINTFSSTRPGILPNGNEGQIPHITNGIGLLTKITDKSELIEQEMFGHAYRFYTKADYDCKVGDILTIGGVEYGVRDFDNNIPDMFENLDNMQVLVVMKQNING